MTLGELKSELKAMLKRGDSLDDQIPGFIRRAARWVEQNHTLQYMRRQIVLDVEGDSTEVDLPQNFPIKTIEYVAFPKYADTRLRSTGKIHVARKGELAEIEWADGGYAPTMFYMDGVERLVFNGLFGQDTQGIGMMVRYSDWPNVDAARHWLIDNAESLLLAQSMLEAATYNRDERTAGIFKLMRDEQVRILLNTDYEMRYAGQDIFLAP